MGTFLGRDEILAGPRIFKNLLEGYDLDLRLRSELGLGQGQSEWVGCDGWVKGWLIHDVYESPHKETYKDVCGGV